ncbi:MAG: cytochrome c4, partial [Gammaproteobacteria bacterium]|nr:cytochrome c4 [Gammaproteobacteria bacterium]
MQSNAKNNRQRLIRAATCNLLIATLTLLVAGAAVAGGDAERGKSKSITCAACHGADGNSINPEWPSLAGQHESYLVRSIQSFKDGSRNNVLMSAQAVALSDQDIQDLAAYFSAQKPSRRTADPALVAQGERIYRGGNAEKGVSACIACHGPGGLGNPGAIYPSLAGQHATYTSAQLMAYRGNERQSDSTLNQVMRNIA